jgi:hypothetical protein
MKNAIFCLLIIVCCMSPLAAARAQTSAPPASFGVNPFSTAQPSAYDRYGNPAPAASTTRPGAVSPPPGAVEGAQGAFGDATGTLRRNVESGFEQTNNALSQSGSRILDSSRSVSEGFGDQLRDLSNSTVRQLEMTGNNLRNTAEQTIGATAGSVRQIGEAIGAPGSAPPPGFDATRQSPFGAPPAGSNNSVVPTNPGGPAPPPGFNTPPAWTSSVPPASAAAGSNPNFPSPATTDRRPSPTSSPSSWTSLDQSVAPPPLLTPSMAPPAGSAANQAAALGQGAPGSAGPALPPLPSSDRPPIHSPLFDPGAGNAASTTSNAAPPNWDTDWNASRNNAVAENDPFSQPPVIGPPDGSSLNQRPAATTPAPGSAASAPNSGGVASQPNWPNLPPASMPANAATTAPVPGQPASPAITTAPTNRTAPGANAPTQATEKDQPWMPLVLASLALVGSLSANFFLGWSYMDARQKYRSLVRKTADKFRRAAEAA